MYSWQGMKKISKKEAIKLFKEGKEVFKLYNDGTESAIHDIKAFNFDYEGYGIEINPIKGRF